MQTPLKLDATSRRFEEAFEQGTEFAGAPEVFRVPLDAEAEARRWILDRFDDAVGRGRGDAESFGDLLHRLMMPAVRFARVGVAQALTQQAREQRVLVDPDFVREVVGLVRRDRPVMFQRTGELGRDVLYQRAAARDVQHLDAAAD